VKPRVAFLHGSNDLYGASRVLVDDVGVLGALGWEVDVVLPEAGPLTELLAGAGATVHTQSLHVLRRVAPSRIRVPLALPAPVAGADLVVLWTLALASYMPALMARRKPTICSVHEILESGAGSVLGAAVGRMAGGVMANSQATAFWMRRCRGVRAMPVVAYPVAPEYRPYDMPAPDRQLQILLAGRVNGQKGHLEAVLACRQARQAGVEVRLTLVGAPFPGQEVHLERLLAAADGADWIQYVGEVPSIQPFLADAHILLVPSTTPEPFGIVALEGWAAGRAVIASDLGGLSEAADLVEAVKCKAGDIDALARILTEIATGCRSLAPAAGTAPVATTCTLQQRRSSWQRLLAEVVPHHLVRAGRYDTPATPRDVVRSSA
jgi:glycosyltransferase involved in cell wall biosynthesis